MWTETLFDYSAICAEDIWIFRTGEINFYETSIGRFYTDPPCVVE